jgi:hypothetical protein
MAMAPFRKGTRKKGAVVLFLLPLREKAFKQPEA